jgi:hypothetical protein
MHGQAFGEGYNIPSWGPTSLAIAPIFLHVQPRHFCLQLPHTQVISPAWLGLWLHPSYPDGDATSLATPDLSHF